MKRNTVFVTHKQWESQQKSIMRANLKAFNRSLSCAGMRAGDYIIEIQDDRKGMIVYADWRTALKRRYLKYVKPVQERLMDALLDAEARTKKTRRQHSVFRFTDDEHDQVHFKVYPHSQGGKALDDGIIGERIELLGYTDPKLVGALSRPLHFWPQPQFKEEFESLPVMIEFEISLYGKPYKEWCAEMEARQA
jgi:hypothetical protein